MKTITQVAKAMQTVLGTLSDEMAVKVGFTQRQSKVSGSVFMQTLVFSSLEHPEWRYSGLVAGALNAGVGVTKQGLEQRFSAVSAELARRMLETAVGIAIETKGAALPVLERFNGVYIRDSSIVSLPKELETLWVASGGSNGGSAGVKLHARLEVRSGQLAGPLVSAAREHDQASRFQTETLPVGALRMGDLGYFSLKQFALDSQQGIFWLSRYKVGTLMYDLHGQPISLLPWLRQQIGNRFERSILLGKMQHLACRLLVERAPAAVAETRKRKLRTYARKKQTPLSAEMLALSEWTLIVTNIPPALLSIPEALVVLRVRWQIELLFKRWKCLFQIDMWRSSNIWRILTELFAKLLSVVIAQWIQLTGMCPEHYPSFWKAALLVRQFATALAICLPSLFQLERILALIAVHIRSHCHLASTKSRPSFYHLLENSIVQP